MPKKSGFTLIELLVVISIIGILSVIGMTMYSGIKLRARDAIRKNDLQSIKLALILYKQQNQSFPTTPSNWVTSFGGGNWISALDSSYFPNGMPKDPLSTGSNSWYWLQSENVSTSYHYAYWAQGCDPYYKEGQFFALVAQLENTNDAERNEVKDYKWCDGKGLYTQGDNNNTKAGLWSKSVYVVTSL